MKFDLLPFYYKIIGHANKMKEDATDWDTIVSRVLYYTRTLTVYIQEFLCPTKNIFPIFCLPLCLTWLKFLNLFISFDNLHGFKII